MPPEARSTVKRFAATSAPFLRAEPIGGKRSRVGGRDGHGGSFRREAHRRPDPRPPTMTSDVMATPPPWGHARPMSTSTTTIRPATFGAGRRWWRTNRRFSQLQLANEAGVSSRHLSFLETGKARPSREMVIHLATVLDLPLRDRNVLLHDAGFAAAYPHSDLDAPEMDDVRTVLRTILGRAPAQSCRRARSHRRSGRGQPDGLRAAGRGRRSRQPGARTDRQPEPHRAPPRRLPAAGAQLGRGRGEHPRTARTRARPPSGRRPAGGDRRRGPDLPRGRRTAPRADACRRVPTSSCRPDSAASTAASCRSCRPSPPSARPTTSHSTSCTSRRSSPATQPPPTCCRVGTRRDCDARERPRGGCRRD